MGAEAEALGGLGIRGGGSAGAGPLPPLATGGTGAALPSNDGADLGEGRFSGGLDGVPPGLPVGGRCIGGGTGSWVARGPLNLDDCGGGVGGTFAAEGDRFSGTAVLAALGPAGVGSRN